jgi:hypothetical protein
MVDNGMAGRLLRHAGARLADMGWMPRYPAAPAKVWASYQPAADIDPRRCEPPLGGAAIQGRRTAVRAGALDCFVASAPRNDSF